MSVEKTSQIIRSLVHSVGNGGGAPSNSKLVLLFPAMASSSLREGGAPSRVEVDEKDDIV